MAYTVDYSGDHALVEGVESATYTDPSDNEDTQVKVRMGSLGTSDYQAGVSFGVSMGDVPFTVWTATVVNGELLPQGQLVTGGINYTIIGILATVPDGSQTRIICRKEL